MHLLGAWIRQFQGVQAAPHFTDEPTEPLLGDNPARGEDSRGGMWSEQRLELFAEDTRQASSITWNSKRSVTLTVSGSPIVYQYDDSAKVFQRLVAGGTRNLLSGVQSFEFKAYNITGAEMPLKPRKICRVLQ